MTFEQQFAVFVFGILAIAAAVLYAVHRLTRYQRFAAIRTDLRDLGHTATVPTTTRRDVGPNRVTVLRGGAGHPSAGTSASNGPRHARAA